MNMVREGLLVERIYQQVQRVPEKEALVFGQKRFSYRELWDQTDRLAAALMRKGIGGGKVVSVLVPRSEYMLICALGVLKTGAAYQPLDATHPVSRIGYMIEDAGSALVIASKEYQELLPAKTRDILWMEEIPSLARPEAEEVKSLLQAQKAIAPEDLFVLLYTSGSTGKPKGCMLEHGNILSFCKWYKHYYEADETCRMAEHASFVFDVSMMELFMPLAAGAAVYIIPEEIRTDLDALNRFFEENGITHCSMTTQLGRQFVLHTKNHSLRHLTVAGEALAPIEPPEGYQLHNGYGPTEGTILLTIHRVTKDDTQTVPIGKPLDEVKIYILDQEGNAVAPGEIGELCAAGPHITRGYLNQPEQTEKAYTPNPFDHRKGYERIYHTGDLVRSSEGRLEYLGRADEQVKIRGFRIELAEVESVLRQCEGIFDATVSAVVRNEEKYLAAYYVSETELDEAKMRQRMSEICPYYMIPSFFIHLDQIPLNVNGKVDKKRLPEPEWSQGGDAFQALESDMERMVAAAYEELFDLDSVGAEGDFLRLGGHSLLAVKLLFLLRERCKKAVMLPQVLAHPVVRELAAVLEESEDIDDDGGIHKLEEKAYYEPGTAQERIYTAQQLCAEDDFSYHLPLEIACEGQLDTDRVKEALASLFVRHEILRTSLTVEDGGLKQKIMPDMGTAPYCDMERQKAVEQWAADAVEASCIQDEPLLRPFAMDRAPLFHWNIRTDKGKTTIFMDWHHSISDGSSMELFAKEFCAAYDRKELPALELQYKEFAQWERKADFSVHGNAWKEMLAGEIPALELRPDKARPALKSHLGETLHSVLSESLCARIASYCKEHGATEYMFLYAVWFALLHKYTGQERIITGTVMAGRDRPELEQMQGMFVHTVPVMSQITKQMTFSELLAQVKERVLFAQEHQAWPLEEIVRDLKAERTPSGNLLFDVLFVMQSAEREMNLSDGKKINLRYLETDTAMYDLTLETERIGNEYHLRLEYDRDLFEQATIQWMLCHYQALVEECIAKDSVSLEGLDMISDKEKKLLLQDFQGQKIEVAECTVIDALRSHAQNIPEQQAVVFGGSGLTYSELNRLSDILADKILRETTGRDGDLGVIFAQRSLEMVIAIFGIMKAGMAYVPVSPAYPEQRIQFLLEDSAPQVIVTCAADLPKEHQQWAKEHKIAILQTELGEDGEITCTAAGGSLAAGTESGEADRCVAAIDIPVKGDQLAYIIYTSGTTGKPKGVMVEHRQLINLLEAYNDIYQITEKDCVLQFADFVFDQSVWDIFHILYLGGTLCLIPPEIVREPEQLERYCREKGVTAASLTPGFLWELHPENLPDLWLLDVGGEAPSGDLLRRWLPGRRVFNTYGPTETTVNATSYLYQGGTGNNVPIGKAIPNTQVYIMRGMELCGIGIPGELCIAGAGVTRGYLHREELTREKYIENPFGEGRMYRSGDIARYLPDGNIEFLGRQDNQVKVRGFRMELEEIENRMSEVEQVCDAAVVIKTSENKDKWICGYYTSDSALEPAQLKGRLEEMLPYYMVPQYLLRMEEMPLTVNGKIDKKALPDPEFDRSETYVPPETDAQKACAETWEEVLEISPVGIEDDFFELGGDSIKAIRIMSHLREKGYETEVRHLLQDRTIRRLEAHLSVRKEAEEYLERKDVPLTPVMWDFLRADMPAPNHYNQSAMLSFDEPVSLDSVQRAVNELAARHSMLRSYVQYPKEDISSGKIKQDFTSEEQRMPYVGVRPADEMPEIAVEESSFSQEICEKCQESLDIENGVIMRVHLFHRKGGSDQVFFVIHHLAVDEVSWGILLEDFSILYQAAAEGKELGSCPLSRTVSFGEWSVRQKEYGGSPAFEREEAYWKEVTGRIETLSPLQDSFLGDSTEGEAKGFTTVAAMLDRSSSAALQQMAKRKYHCRLDALLLAGLSRSLKQHFQIDACPVYMESHGRGILQEDLRTERTVGWFTAVYPMILRCCDDAEEQIIECKEELLSIPNEGMGYGIYRQKCGKELIPGGIVFNYLGEEQSVKFDGIQVCSETFGTEISPENGDKNTISFNLRLLQDGLEILCTYDNRMGGEKIAKLLEGFTDHLRKLAEKQTEGGLQGKYAVLTPSDVSEPGTVSMKDWKVLCKQFQPEACERIFTLTPLQEGMLYHWMADHDTTSYILQDQLAMHGEWNAACMEKALHLLSMRYEALRTSFYHEGLSRSYQVIWKEKAIYFEVIEGGDPGKYREQECQRHFSLSEDSLIRVLAFPGQEGEATQLLVTQHHIILDGWSFPVLLRSLEQYYLQLCAGKSMEEMEKTVREETRRSCTYSSYLSLRQKKNQDQSESAGYWKQYLDGYSEGVAISPTGEGKENAGEQIYTIALERPLEEKLREMTAEMGITLSTLFETAWGILLQRENNQEDAVFGKTVSGRNIDLPGIEQAVGLFINTVPVRVFAGGGITVRELLRQQQEKSLASMPYEDMSLSEVQSMSGLGEMLVQTLFVYENYFVEKEEESIFEAETLREETNYPAAFFVEERETLTLNMLYDGGKYPEKQMHRLIRRIENIVREIAQDPDKKVEELSVITDEERREMMGDFSGKRLIYPPKSFPMILREEAQKRPDAIAVRFYGQSMTYGQLYEDCEKLAHQLGCGKERFVAVFAQRGLEMVVSVIGAMFAGAAYVPVDPQYPDDRIRYILNDCKPEIILRSVPESDAGRIGEMAGEFGIPIYDVDLETIEGMAERDREEQLFAAMPEWEKRAAYIIYTSGTTGNPKGVVITHAGLTNMVYANMEFYGFCKEDVVLQLANYVFDQSVMDIFNTLGAGGTLCLVSRDTMRTAEALAEYCNEQGVTVLMSTTVMLGAFHPEQFHGLRFVDCGGDIARREILDRWRAVADLVVNTYGPTETTVNATAFVYDRPLEGSVPIGVPLPNKKIYILQGEKLCGVGMKGEICITGEGLAREYLNKPEQTEKSFVKNPLGEGRMYRTGDIGKYLENGAIFFEGRMDSQIKLRGYRIELAEIQHHLCDLPQIEEAEVVCFRDGGQDTLAAYIVCGDGITADEGEILAELKKKMPYYMIPDAIVQLPAIPLNQSGKLDVRALEVPVRKSTHEYEEPKTDMEKKIAGLYEEILGNDSVGRNDSFFELGGNSIDVMRLVSALADHHVAVEDIFACDTPRLLGEKLSGAQEAQLEERRPHVLWKGKKEDAVPALICLPPSGGLSLCYSELLQELEWEGTVYGLNDMKYGKFQKLSDEELAQIEENPPEQWEETMEAYWRQIQKIWKDGDILVGYSQGGSASFLIAQRLEKQGDHPGAVFMLESEPHRDDEEEPSRQEALQIAGLEEKERKEWSQAEKISYLVAWQNIANPLKIDGKVSCPIYVCNLSGGNSLEEGKAGKGSNCWKPYTSGESKMRLIPGTSEEHLVYLQKYKREISGWIRQCYKENGE